MFSTTWRGRRDRSRAVATPAASSPPSWSGTAAARPIGRPVPLATWRAAVTLRASDAPTLAVHRFGQADDPAPAEAFDRSPRVNLIDDLDVRENIELALQYGEVPAREHKARVEQAGFAVLKAPDIPSILVETGFISNPEEESKLKDEAYQGQLADALLAGIQRYFARNPPLARNRAL